MALLKRMGMEGNHNLAYDSITLFKKIYQTIQAHQMFQPGEKVLVGVSGGPDSVALLHILRGLSPELNLTLAVAHFNHDLRGNASIRDAGFVAALADRLHLTFYSEKGDVRAYRRRHRLSLETAARKLRYAFLLKTIETHNFDKIALGHHMDDNAEQILMNLLRGSGPTGLSGIPPVRDDHIVRPMMGVTRGIIMDYLACEKHDYVIDASNADPKHLRNRIRLDLLPHMTANYNPRLVQGLNQMAEVFRSENRWMEQVVASVFEEVAIECGRQSVVLSIPKVAQVEPAIQRRLFRRAILEISGDLKKITFEHIEDIRAMLNDGRAFKSIDLPHRIRVRRMDQSLSLSQEVASLRMVPHIQQESVSPPFSYLFEPPGDLLIEEVGLHLSFSLNKVGQPITSLGDTDSITYMDADKLTFPVTVRSQKSSDRFSPLGLGGNQTVRKFLSKRESNHHNRMKCPVMTSENRIVWVIGHGIADEVKIDRRTRYALMVRVSLA